MNCGEEIASRAIELMNKCTRKTGNERGILPHTPLAFPGSIPLWNMERIGFIRACSGQLRGSFRCKVAIARIERKEMEIKCTASFRCTRNCGAQLEGQSTSPFEPEKRKAKKTYLSVLFLLGFYATQFPSTLCPFSRHFWRQFLRTG